VVAILAVAFVLTKADSEPFAGGSDSADVNAVTDATSAAEAADTNAQKSAEVANTQLEESLGPAYAACVRALGTRTTAYLNNYSRAAGLVATVKIIRQLYSSLGAADFVSFLRQYAALLGGAGGFQLNALIQAFGRANLSTLTGNLAASYQALGADLLRVFQSLILSTGGRASIKAAKIYFAFVNQVGDDSSAASELNAILSSVGSTTTGTVSTQAKDLGVILGYLYNKLGVNIVTFAAANPTTIEQILTAARNLQAIGVFNFASLTTYNALKVGQIIATAITTNNINIVV